MANVPITNRQRMLAMRVVEMLREECKDNLAEAVMVLNFTTQIFNKAFANTVAGLPKLQKRLEKGG